MVLVTGAAGFVGAHLVTALSAAGRTVRALYRNTQPSEKLRHLPGVEWQRCDLLDVFAIADAIAGVETIFHCAATVSFSGTEGEQLLHNNRESTANVVNAALDADTPHLVHLSSVAALGRSVLGAPLTEESLWEDGLANSKYAQSKWAAELEVWRGAGEGLSVSILNPGIILGEPLMPAGWQTGSAALLKVAAGGFPFYTEGINGWVDVVDVVRALMLLEKQPETAERFLLVEGNYSYQEVLSGMAVALGRKPPHIGAGPFLSGLVWRWNAVRKLFGATPTVTRETARTAQQKVFYDSTKWERAFPAFPFTPLTETLARMGAAYQQDLGGAGG
jgi:nucleoside-diphosphate-sugar epimerase